MNKTIIIAILTFIIGMGAGWIMFGKGISQSAGTHRMPDGTLMNNNGTDMKSMMHDMNANLVGKTGDAFDQAFLSDMIMHHEGAVDMAKLVLESSSRNELKKLAQDIITAQTQEIVMMKNWQKEWFGK